MRTFLFCWLFVFLSLQTVLSLPIQDLSRFKSKPDQEKFTRLGSRGKVLHTHTMVKDLHILSNSSNTWSRPRCGVPDPPHHNEVHYSGHLRQRRFVLHGGRLDKTNLTYRIVRFPWQIREEMVRRVFREALKIWSDVTPLTFTEIHSGKADMRIDFTRYWHGDNLPFDGPGGILAHAFFPKTHRQGDIHFDYDESWTVGNHMGTDLLQVAAHEFGHVLGLQHSREPGAIMSAYYSFSYPLRLSNDDQQGIQYLYGAQPRVQSAPTGAPPVLVNPETNEIVTSPDACQTDFDAVSMIRGELFFFKSGFVWRIRDGRLESGYPALASRHWKGIPDNIDAAFEDKSGNVWFFKDENYWVFDAEMQIRGPDSIRRLGLSISGIRAAMRWGQDSNYNTYFFMSGSYWKFSPRENRVESAYPYSLRDWNGIPNNVDAAFRDIYGYAHFIRGRQYWKFDLVGMNSLEGYPRHVGVDFFACRSV